MLKFSSAIVDWYMQHHRTLPWRETSDPYKIWLSEIILQQTRVAQGLPYYQRFIKSFPTVESLANASQQQVLRLWQGLGYYSRARNLHACAKTIVSEWQGAFPNNYKGLLALKGIGPYTAAAIASFAFKEPVAVVDGNVFRVLSRIFGMEEDISTSKGKELFTEKANALISKDRPDLFNQAMMEFGALQCVPKNPKCEECIFSKSCVARKHELQNVLPIKSKKIKVRNRYFYYFVLRHQNKVLMKKREGKDIWQGLYDFYLIETKRNKKVSELLKTDPILKGLTKTNESKIYKHVLSHQKLVVRFVEMESKKTQILNHSELEWFTDREITKLPKPILIANYMVDRSK
ncbi:MAG: A/G-specific adenine glycosylase [Cyclobacteriaceae bacterium]|nr:A/G-specific adenine glycosylase [Cyclobacteriaceae bacterium]